MSYDDQLDIKELRSGVFRLEFPYDAEFIESLKNHVPYQDRSYDEVERSWTVHGEKYLPKIIASAERRFRHIVREFRRGEDLVRMNVRTGVETVQRGLF